MIRTRHLVLVCALLGCGALLLTSCSDSGGSDPGPVDCDDMPGMLDVARSALENKLYQHLQSGAADPNRPGDVDFGEAQARYADAYACDNTNLEARLGLAICNMLVLSTDADVNAAFDAWDAYLDLHTPFERPNKSGGRSLRSLLGVPSDAAALHLPFELVRDNVVANMNAFAAGEPQVAEVQRILREIVLPEVEEAIDLLGPVAASEAFTFTVTGRMQGDPDEDAAEIDRTDVLVLRAACRLLAAGIRVGTSYDVQFSDYDDAGMLAGLDRDTGNVMTLVVGGAARMQEVPAYITGAVDELQAAISSLLAETDPQEDDVIKIGPDDVAEADLYELRDTHLPDIAEAFTSGGIVYTEDWDTDSSTPDTPLRVNLAAFFANPVADWKLLLPPYTLDTAVRARSGYVGHGSNEIFLPDPIPVPADYAGGSWRSYDVGYRDFARDYSYADGMFPDLIAACDAWIEARIGVYEALPDWSGYASFHFTHSGNLVPGVDNVFTFDVGVSYDTADEFIYVPEVTWEAADWATWAAQMPDVTLNGLFPDIADGPAFCATFGFTEETWDRTFVWNYMDMGDVSPPAPPRPGP